jgi:hypothetical protein
MDQVSQVADWINAAHQMAVLTGAGISTDSGIPDFRGPNGLWTTNPETQRLFTLRDYLSDKSAEKPGGFAAVTLRGLPDPIQGTRRLLSWKVPESSARLSPKISMDCTSWLATVKI